MELSPPPAGLEAEHATLFTTDSLLFLHELISTFDEEVDQVNKKVFLIRCMEDLFNSG